MESLLVEQAAPTGRSGRWIGWRIGRSFGLVLVAGLVLAGLFLARRGLPAPAIANTPAPVVEIATSAEAVAVVAPALLSYVAAKTQAPAPDTLQPPAALDVADTTSPEDTAPVAAGAEIFPVLEGLAATSDDWLVVRDVSPGEDPENGALGGTLAHFSLQPMAAPCCPLPTSDKAVDAALGLPGVLAAKVNDAGTLLVRYDPAQIAPAEIASRVNQASFLVQAVEANE